MAVIDEASVRITPDTSGFAAELRAEVEAAIEEATAGLDKRITIHVDVDVDDAEAKMHEAMDRLGNSGHEDLAKLKADEKDLYDDIAQNSEKSRVKQTTEQTKLRDKLKSIWQPAVDRLKQQQLDTKKRYDQITASALKAAKAAGGDATAGTNAGVARAEAARKKAYEDSEAAARKLTKAELDLDKERAKGQQLAAEAEKAERGLQVQRNIQSATTDAIRDKEQRLDDLRKNEPNNIRQIGQLEKELQGHREALAARNDQVAAGEDRVNKARLAVRESTLRANEAEATRVSSQDRLVESTKKVEDAERNVTRAHEEHNREMERSNTVLGRLSNAMSGFGRESKSTGSILKDVKAGMKDVSIAGGLVETGIKAAASAFESFGKFATDAASQASDFGGSLLGVAKSFVQLGATSMAYLTVGAAVSYVVGAIGAAVSGLPALVGAAAASFAVFKLGMDGITKAYNAGLKPAIDALSKQVSDVFEKRLTPIFKELGDKLISKVTEQMKGLANAFSDGAQKITDMVTKAENVAHIQSIIDKTSQAVRDLGQPLADATEKFIRLADTGTILQNMVGIVQDLVTNVGNWMDQMARSGDAERAVAALRSTLSNLEQVFLQVLTSATNFFTQVQPGFDNLVQGVGKVVSALLDRLGPAFNQIFQAIGDGLKQISPEVWDGLRDAVQRVADVIKRMADDGSLKQFFETAIRLITKGIDAFGKFIDIVDKVMSTLRKIDSAAKPFNDFMHNLLGDLDPMNSKLDESGNKIGDVGSAAGTAAPPVDQLGQAASGLGDKAQAGADKAGAAAASIPPPFKRAADDVDKALQPLPQNVQQQLGAVPPIAAAAGTATANAWNQPVAAIPGQTGTALNPTPPAVTSALNPAADAASTAGGKMAGEFNKQASKVPGQTGTALNPTAPAVTSALDPAAQAAADASKTAAQNAVDPMTGVPKNVEAALAPLPDTVKVPMTAAAQQAKIGAQAVATAFDLKPLVADATTQMQQLSDAITTKFDTIKTAADTFKTQLTTAFTAVQTSIQQAQTAITTAMSTITTAIATGATGALATITTNFDQIKQKVTETMTAVEQAVQQGMDKVAQTIQTTGQTAVQNAQKVGDDILKVFTDLADKMEQAGQTMMQRLAAGITAGGAAAVAAAQGVAAQIKAQFPSSPAKEGPLSGQGDTLISGGKIMERLGQGIDAKAQAVIDKLQKVVDKANQMIGSMGGGGDDSFNGNSASDPNRGRAGYSQAEDGSWVPNNYWGTASFVAPAATQSMTPQQVYAAVAAGVAAGMPDKLRIEDDGRNGVARLGNRGNRAMARQ